MRKLMALFPVTLLLTACTEEEEAPPTDWVEVSYVDEGQVCHDAVDGVLTLTVAVQECLSSSCSRDLVTSCEATLDGTTLTLTSDIHWEDNMADGATCTDDCGLPAATCELENVPDGTYTLDFDGQSYTIEVPGSSDTTSGCWF